MASRERVAPDDLAWLHMDRPYNPMVVTTLIRFEGPADWERINAAVNERVINRFPRFSQRVVAAGTSTSCAAASWATTPWANKAWEDDPHFRLERHLRHHRLHHHRSRGADSDRALQELIGNQLAAPLSELSPAWRLHLIDDDQGASSLVLRSHHSLADGLGLVQILLALADPPADGGLHPQQLRLADQNTNSEPGSSGRESATAAGWALPFDLSKLDLTVESARRAAATYRKLGLLAEQRNPWRGHLSGRKQYVWSAPVALDTVKLVAAATGATINDLGLAVIAAAMHAYFAPTGLIPYRVGATVPFNLRSLDQPLVSTVGNQIGLVFVNLPVGIADRKQRLDHIRRRMARIKASPEGEMVGAGMALANSVSPPEMARAWMELFTRKSTAVITNIAGPRTRLTIADTPVDSFMMWVPTSGQVAVGLSIVTYADSLRIGVQVDTGVVSDVERFVDLISAELAQVDRYLVTR